MSRMPARVGLNLVLPLALHAFLIWLACGATMVLGRETLGLEAALRVHVVAAPIVAIVSWLYFKRFHAALLLLTAAFFVNRPGRIGAFPMACRVGIHDLCPATAR